MTLRLCFFYKGHCMLQVSLPQTQFLGKPWSHADWWMWIRIPSFSMSMSFPLFPRSLDSTRLKNVIHWTNRDVSWERTTPGTDWFHGLRMDGVSPTCLTMNHDRFSYIYFQSVCVSSYTLLHQRYNNNNNNDDMVVNNNGDWNRINI